MQWDLIAGLSVGFMVVPQGMSYANIAGLPSVYGLYGAFLPVLVYAVFGGSRELAVGPVAVTSLLLSSALKQLVPGSEEISNPNKPLDDQVGFRAYNDVRVRYICMLGLVGQQACGMQLVFECSRREWR